MVARMGLHVLRRRLLVAIGLPVAGCGGASPDRGPAVLSNEVAEAPAVGCGVDRISEVVCGFAADRACGPTAASLDEPFLASAPITSPALEPGDGSLRRFRLDQAALARHADELAPFAHGAAACCYSACATLEVGAGAEVERPAYAHTLVHQCVAAPDGGTRYPAADAPACPAAVELDGRLRPFAETSEGACCYTVPSQRRELIRGRPARVAGAPHVAPVTAAPAWPAPVAPEVAALPPPLRRRLAAAWTVTGQLEHASIAAFANLALRLLAAGAPPALIEAAHRAALDEVAHARLAFGLASAYAGAPVGPADFASAAAMTAGGGVVALARETFVDGCVGEAIAAEEARRAATRAVDPAVAAALATIAEDEARHAELGWAIVAWSARHAGPGLVAMLEATLDDAGDGDGGGGGDDDGALDRHGFLGPRAVAALRAEVIAAVVRPCLAALGRAAAC
jgi:hypothetical protein